MSLYSELNLVRMVQGKDRLRAPEYMITKVDPYTYLVVAEFGQTIEVPASNVTFAIVAPELPKTEPPRSKAKKGAGHV